MFAQDCSEDEDCLERMLVLEPDSPVASADRRHDYKFVSAALVTRPVRVITSLIYVASTESIFRARNGINYSLILSVFMAH